MELGSALDQVTPVDEVDQPAQDVAAFSLRGGGRIILSSWSGRIGLVMFAVMIAISAYVLLTYPSNFGSQIWSSPKEWANNPKTVPPKWTALWDSNAVENQSASITDPSATSERGAATISDYVWTISQ
jgi:hypothetical protein